MPSVVRKAVFPASGLGTRFLPATKAQPKEMLPLVDKPLIQYGAALAVLSGARNIILVTGRGKNAIEDHFDVNVEHESFLQQRGKTEQLDEIDPDECRRHAQRFTADAMCGRYERIYDELSAARTLQHA